MYATIRPYHFKIINRENVSETLITFEKNRKEYF